MLFLFKNFSFFASYLPNNDPNVLMFSTILSWKYSVKSLLDSHVYDIHPIFRYTLVQIEKSHCHRTHSKEVYKLIVDVRSFRIEEARARAKFMKEEEILFKTNFSMVSFSCFFLKKLPFFKLFWIREWNSIDSL